MKITILYNQNHLLTIGDQLPCTAMLKGFLRIIAATLLLLNGLGAIYGGWELMSQPDGSSLEMSTTLLQHSPFSTFAIPGLVLFSLNGLCSLLVFVSVITNGALSPILTIGQGLILTGWIVTEVLMIPTFSWLQVVFGCAGLMMIAAGIALSKLNRAM